MSAIQRERASLLRAYAPAPLWAALVLFVGGREGIGSPLPQLPLDKVAHFLLYGVLGTLAGWGWLRAGGRPGAFVPVLAGLALGAIDELQQTRLPTRTASIADWVFDALGVWLGFTLIRRSRGARRGEAE